MTGPLHATGDRATMISLLGRDAWVEMLWSLASEGATVLVHGPVGIGKTALLEAVEQRAASFGVPCARTARTEHLGDVTAALAQAFPDPRYASLGARRLRSALRDAADRTRVVLLLDGAASPGTALKGYLRSLRGAGLGVVLAVDTDAARDRGHVRAYGLAHREIALPPLHGATMRSVLARRLETVSSHGSLDRDGRAALVRAAEGRPGLLLAMTERLADPRYWFDGRPRLQLLRTDAGIDLARRALDEHLAPAAVVLGGSPLADVPRNSHPPRATCKEIE